MRLAMSRRSLSRNHSLRSRPPSTLGGLAIGAGAASAFTMQAAWINDAEFMGYFIAIDKGWYAEEGLELTYLSGGPDVIPESSLLSNKADLALTTPDTTAKAVVDQGADFRIIGTQYQKNPIGVVSLASNPVQRARGPDRQDPRGPARQRHLGRSDVPAQRYRAGRGQGRALRLRPHAARQGRDRRLDRLHHQRPLHHQAGGAGGGVVPALRLRLHHLQRHGGGRLRDAEEQAQGAGGVAAREPARLGGELQRHRTAGRRSSPTRGSRGPGAPSRTRSTSTTPRGR